MCWGVAAAAAISAYAANGGKLDGWGDEPKDDWMAMEERRMKRLQRETRAAQRQALLGVVLLIGLVVAVIYAVMG